YLIVVNFSEGAAQTLVHVPWDELRGKTWRLSDSLTGDTFDRGGDDMRDNGFYVDLGPWGFHFFWLNLR
ncbi:MAG: alpha-amylase, partial [Chloroflexota bacterium]